MLVQNLLIYFAYLFAASLFFSVTGAAIARILPRGLTSEPVLQPFHGILFWVLVFSSVYTSGKTVQLTILSYFIFQALFESSVSEPKNSKYHNAFFNAIISFVFSVPVLIIFYFFIFRSNNSITLPFMDEVFYGKISSIMTLKGFETNQIDSLWQDGISTNTPYHYFEIWLTVIFTQVSGISPLLSFKLLAVPTLFGTGSGILFALAKHRNLSNFRATFVVIFTLFTGLSFGFQQMADWSIPQTMKVQIHYLTDFIPLNRVKLSTVFLFLSAFTFLYNKENRISWFPLLLLGALWISLTPSIWFLAGFVLLNKYNSRKDILVFSSFVVAILFLFFFLYSFNKNKIEFDNSIVFLKYQSFRIVVGTILYEFLVHFLIVAPVLIYYLLFKKRINLLKDFIIIFPISIGIFIHAITIGSVDSFQFVSNVSGVFLQLFFYSFYLRAFSGGFWKNYYSLFFLISVVLFQFYTCYKTLAYSYSNYKEEYSLDFIERVGRLVVSSGTTVGTLSSSQGGHFDSPYTNYEGAFFLYTDPKVRIAQLNCDLALGSIQEQGFQTKVKSAWFLAFAQKERFLEYSKARIAFIEKYHPEVLVVNPKINIKDYPEFHKFLGPMLIDSISRTKVFTLSYPKAK